MNTSAVKSRNIKSNNNYTVDYPKKNFNDIHSNEPTSLIDINSGSKNRFKHHNLTCQTSRKNKQRITNHINSIDDNSEARIEDLVRLQLMKARLSQVSHDEKRGSTPAILRKILENK